MRDVGRGPRTDRPMLHGVQKNHPGLREAVAADARLASHQRGDRSVRTSRMAVARRVVHLIWATDAFGALALYRVRAACQRRGIPVVPTLAHRLAMTWAQVSIGDPVRVEPGVLLPHGQVVIDGFVEIGQGAQSALSSPSGWSTPTYRGPTIGPDVKIGTGAKVLGPIVVGAGAQIGANAVVIDDVDPGAAVKGVPARGS